jgi:hypothetical protein
MTRTKLNNTTEYVDLVISEAHNSERTPSGSFRFCTLTKSRGQRTINLRLPDEIQEKIIAAYEKGKTVRIFA